MATQKLDIILRARDKASGAFGKVGGVLGRFTKQLFSLKSAIVGTLGGVALGALAKQSIDAFAIQEKAIANLRDALISAGDAGASSLGDLKRFASELQSITTIGDEATLKLSAFIATLSGQTGEALRESTLAATAIGRAVGQNAEAVAIALNRIRQGEKSTALDRFIPQLKQAATETERWAAINEVANRGLQQMRSDALTSGGAIQQMHNAVGDLKEVIGEALAPVVVNVADTIKRLAEGFGATAGTMNIASKEGNRFAHILGVVKDAMMDLIFLTSNFKEIFFQALVIASAQAQASMLQILDRMASVHDGVRQATIERLKAEIQASGEVLGEMRHAFDKMMGESYISGSRKLKDFASDFTINLRGGLGGPLTMPSIPGISRGGGGPSSLPGGRESRFLTGLAPAANNDLAIKRAVEDMARSNRTIAEEQRKTSNTLERVLRELENQDTHSVPSDL